MSTDKDFDENFEKNFKNIEEKKTDLRKLVSRKKKRRMNRDLKMNQTIREMLEHTATSSYTLNDLLEETDCLAILNRAKINNFLNLYITRIFDCLEGAQILNNKLLAKIAKRQEIINSQELTKVYIRTKELEMEQLKLVTEFSKVQQAKLDVPEQNMIIIYRSLPDNLKSFMYKTVMEFVRKCPAIQRELLNQKANVQENQQ